MAKKLYPQITEGQKVELDYKNLDYKMACCDCGLVHRLRFDVKKGKLIIQGWRENQATGQLRRNRKFNKK